MTDQVTVPTEAQATAAEAAMQLNNIDVFIICLIVAFVFCVFGYFLGNDKKTVSDLKAENQRAIKNVVAEQERTQEAKDANGVLAGEITKLKAVAEDKVRETADVALKESDERTKLAEALESQKAESARHRKKLLDSIPFTHLKHVGPVIDASLREQGINMGDLSELPDDEYEAILDKAKVPKMARKADIRKQAYELVQEVLG